jgi:hypothetical protein
LLVCGDEQNRIVLEKVRSTLPGFAEEQVMKLGSFSGPKWRGFHRWNITIFGIGFILRICQQAGKGVKLVWPNWGWIVCLALVVNAVFLSWLWFRRVRKAAEDGEFD